MGGEEFLIILPETDLAGAESVAEKLRYIIETNSLLYQEKTIQITISFGVSIFDEYLSVDDYIKQADTCLYRAKQNGRNQVALPELKTCTTPQIEEERAN